MKLRLSLLLMLGISFPLFAQRANTFYVAQFENRDTRTVGAMTAKAQAACSTDVHVPCVIVFDPTLAVYAVGTMPAKCSQCVWVDWRSFDPSSTLPAFPGAVPGNVKFVFEGDSHTAVLGGGIAAGEDYPAQLMLLSNFAGKGTATNAATGGDTCAGVTTEYASQVRPLRPSGSGARSYLLLEIGINEVIAGTAASTITTCLSNYWTTAKNDGFTVIAFTLLYGYYNGTAAWEGVRQAVNDFIRTSPIPDRVIDLEIPFPPTNNALGSSPGSPGPYRIDTMHLNKAGNFVRAKYVNAMLSLPTSILATAMPEQWYSRSGTMQVENGAFMVGDTRATAAQKGDIGCARTTTGCVIWLGSDGAYFFRDSATSVTYSPGVSLKVPATELVGGIAAPTGFGVAGDVGGTRFFGTAHCFASNTLCWTTGAGAPGGGCTTGAMYTRTDGGAGTTLYVCQAGAWAAK